VQELRELSQWSDGHIWVSPEQHGNLVSRLCQHLVSNSFTNYFINNFRPLYSRTRLIGFH
jgi:hypothetical protein